MNKTQKPKVGVATGATRSEAVAKALELVSDDVVSRLKGNILIKPNFLSSWNKLATTQADAVGPILDFLVSGGINMENVTIGEGGSRSTSQAFENFGYNELKEKYGVKLRDLNRSSYTRQIELVTSTGAIHNIEYADWLEEYDTIISVPVAKTHDAAMVTLSIKNMMGCLKRVKRPRMHGIVLGEFAEGTADVLWRFIEDHSYIIKGVSAAVFKFVSLGRKIDRLIHGGKTPGLVSHIGAMAENISRLAGVLMPDIAVIDGFIAMEGNGPGGAGTPVDLRIAVAGTDPVACDTVMAYLMGFEPETIGWLVLAGQRGLGISDMSMIECLGEDPVLRRISFKPHVNYPVQLKWREAGI